MYCYECGATFTGDPDTCPFCGSDDICESERCAICGVEFPEGETHEGLCVHCLWDAITYDVALAYLIDSKQLADFFISYIFNAGTLSSSSYELDMFLQETYKRMVANDKLEAAFGGRAMFLEQCRYFILPDKDEDELGTEGREFADWYSERYYKEGKK